MTHTFGLQQNGQSLQQMAESLVGLNMFGHATTCCQLGLEDGLGAMGSVTAQTTLCATNQLHATRGKRAIP